MLQKKSGPHIARGFCFWIKRREKPMIEFAYDCETHNMGGGSDATSARHRPSGSQPDGTKKGGSECCPCFVTSYEYVLFGERSGAVLCRQSRAICYFAVWFSRWP